MRFDAHAILQIEADVRRRNDANVQDRIIAKLRFRITADVNRSICSSAILRKTTFYTLSQSRIAADVFVHTIALSHCCNSGFATYCKCKTSHLQSFCKSHLCIDAKAAIGHCDFEEVRSCANAASYMIEWAIYYVTTFSLRHVAALAEIQSCVIVAKPTALFTPVAQESKKPGGWGRIHTGQQASFRQLRCYPNAVWTAYKSYFRT